jgi:hypothetical protein
MEQEPWLQPIWLLTAWATLNITSREACPVKTFFNASDVNGKCGPPDITSPKRTKGTTKLERETQNSEFRIEKRTQYAANAQKGQQRENAIIMSECMPTPVSAFRDANQITKYFLKKPNLITQDQR